MCDAVAFLRSLSLSPSLSVFVCVCVCFRPREQEMLRAKKRHRLCLLDDEECLTVAPGTLTEIGMLGRSCIALCFPTRWNGFLFCADSRSRGRYVNKRFC